MPQVDHGWNRRRLLLGLSAIGLMLLLGLGVFITARSVGSPPPGSRKVPRIGYLALGSRDNAGHVRLRHEFVQGLGEHGYEDGRDIVIEYRYADGDVDRLRALTTELVDLPADLVVAADAQSVPLAAEATNTIPIIMAVFSDPVGAGFAQSLARPGGNVTGLSNQATALVGKRLELIKELRPEASRVAVLWNANLPGVQLQWRQTQDAASTLGLDLISLAIQNAQDISPAFEMANREGAEALIMLPDPLTLDWQQQIIELAGASRLPAVYGRADMAQNGGLLAIGPDVFGMMHRVSNYIDRILKGASAAELPIEQPANFEIVINLKTAQALGLTIPRDLLLDATAVIQ